MRLIKQRSGSNDRRRIMHLEELESRWVPAIEVTTLLENTNPTVPFPGSLREAVYFGSQDPDALITFNDYLFTQSVNTPHQPTRLAIGNYRQVSQADVVTIGGPDGSYDLAANITGAGNLIPGGPLTPGDPRLTSSFPIEIETATLDPDNIDDFVLLEGESFVPYSGASTGSFSRGMPQNLGFGTYSGLVVGYFDPGFTLDAATVQNGANGNVLMAFGNGAGGFSGVVAIPTTSSNLTGLAIADMNGDGLQDVIVTSSDGSLETLFQSDTPSMVIPGSYYPNPGVVTPLLTINPGLLAMGKMDDDSIGDAVVVDASGASLSVLQGKIDGTFVPVSTVDLGANAAALQPRIADLNGDGKTDVVLPLAGQDRIAAYIGNGKGSFDTKVLNAGVIDPTDVRLAEMTGDGCLDIVVTSGSTKSFAVYQVSDANRFQTADVQQLPVSILAGEFDDFAGMDIVTVTGIAPGAAFANGSLTSNPFLAPNPSPRGLAVNPVGSISSIAADRIESANLNGDGKQDLVALAINSRQIQSLLGDGKGGFNAGTIISFSGTPIAMVVGDINIDGRSDVSVALGNGTVISYLGDGTGGFVSGGLVVTTKIGNLVGLAAGDINGDGWSDLVALGANGSRAVLTRKPDGQGFSSRPINSIGPLGSAASSLAVVKMVGADLYADGVVTDSTLDQVRIYQGSQTGGLLLEQTIQLPSGTGPNGVKIGDVTGDGLLDLVVSMPGLNRIGIFEGNATGIFGTTYKTLSATNVMDVRLVDFDGNGTLEILAALGSVRQYAIFQANQALTLHPLDNKQGTIIVNGAIGNYQFNNDTNIELRGPGRFTEGPLANQYKLTIQGDIGILSVAITNGGSGYKVGDQLYQGSNNQYGGALFVVTNVGPLGTIVGVDVAQPGSNSNYLQGAGNFGLSGGGATPQQQLLNRPGTTGNGAIFSGNAANLGPASGLILQQMQGAQRTLTISGIHFGTANGVTISHNLGVLVVDDCLFDNSDVYMRPKLSNNYFRSDPGSSGLSIIDSSLNDCGGDSVYYYGDGNLNVTRSIFKGNDDSAVIMVAGGNVIIDEAVFDANGGQGAVSVKGNSGSSVVVVTKTIFTNNSSQYIGYQGGALERGGTLGLRNVRSVSVDQCFFGNNLMNGTVLPIPGSSIDLGRYSTGGAAICAPSVSSRIDVTNSVFSNNTVAGINSTESGGAAIYNYGAELNVIGCAFEGNEILIDRYPRSTSFPASPNFATNPELYQTPRYSGGGAIYSGGSTLLADSFFTSNRVLSWVDYWHRSLVPATPTSLPQYSGGGAVYLTSSNSGVKHQLINVTMVGNSAEQVGQLAFPPNQLLLATGAGLNGGAIIIADGRGPISDNNLIDHPITASSSTKFINCTIAGNALINPFATNANNSNVIDARAALPGFFGAFYYQYMNQVDAGGVFVDTNASSPVNIENTIIVNNSGITYSRAAFGIEARIETDTGARFGSNQPLFISSGYSYTNRSTCYGLNKFPYSGQISPGDIEFQGELINFSRDGLVEDEYSTVIGVPYDGQYQARMMAIGIDRLSPARDSGLATAFNSIISTPLGYTYRLDTDARGANRKIGGSVDMGAYEAQIGTQTVVSSPVLLPANLSHPNPYVSLQFGEQIQVAVDVLPFDNVPTSSLLPITGVVELLRASDMSVIGTGSLIEINPGVSSAGSRALISINSSVEQLLFPGNPPITVIPRYRGDRNNAVSIASPLDMFVDPASVVVTASVPSRYLAGSALSITGTVDALSTIAPLSGMVEVIVTAPSGAVTTDTCSLILNSNDPTHATFSYNRSGFNELGVYATTIQFVPTSSVLLDSSNQVLSVFSSVLTTNTAISLPVGQVVRGGSITLSATVSPSNTDTLLQSGTVDFLRNDGTIFASAALSDSTIVGGSRVYSVSIDSSLFQYTLPGAPNHVLTARYNQGAGFYESSTSPPAALDLIAPPGTTAMALSFSGTGNVVPRGMSVTIATNLSSLIPASPNATYAGGEVEFFEVSSDGRLPIGRAPVVNGMVGSLSYLPSAIGQFMIEGAYRGDSWLAPVSFSVPLTVANITLTPITPTYRPRGSIITLSATVNPIVDGNNIPASGSVSFVVPGSNGSPDVVIATVPASAAVNGVFSTIVDSGLAASNLPVGSYNVVAQYIPALSDVFPALVSNSSGLVIQRQNVALSATVSANSTAYGDSITVQCQIDPAVPGTTLPFAANNFVTLYDGSQGLIVLPFTDGQRSVSFVTSGLSAGVHALQFVYGGDANYQAALSLPLTVTVARAAATISLATSTAIVALGGTVTLTTRVTPPANYPPVGPLGTVTFKANGLVVGVDNVANDGSSRFVYTPSFTGNYSIEAVYSGSQQYPSTTAVASLTSYAFSMAPVSPVGGNLGDIVTLKATLSSFDTDIRQAGGVDFVLANGSVLASVPSSASTMAVNGREYRADINSALVGSGLRVGTISVQAVYNRTGLLGEYPRAYSSARSFSLSAQSTRLLATPPEAPVILGANSVVSATVFPNNVASDFPFGIGNVILYEGATALQTASVTDAMRTVTFSTASLSIGRHILSLQYSGDGLNYQGSRSTAFALTIARADPDVSIVASKLVTSLGQSTLVTATANGAVGISGIRPSGVVRFMQGTEVLGSAVLVNGKAALAYVPKRVETASITAMYLGDVNFDTDASIVNVVSVGRSPYMVVAAQSGSTIKTFDARTKALIASFQPMGAGYTGGFRVAKGDVTGDNVPDFVVTANTGSVVKVYDGQSQKLAGSFTAFASTFSVPVNLAIADINGDGRGDIVAAPGGAVLNPAVRVFSGNRYQLLKSMPAFAAGYKGAVSLAAGDVDGDGRADIVCAPASGGSAAISVFSGVTGLALASFADIKAPVGGATVAVGDLTGDGKAEIVLATLSGSSRVTVYDGATHAVLSSFQAFGSFAAGARVTFGTDLNQDGQPELVVGSGIGGNAQVRRFNALNGQLVDAFFAFAAGTKERNGGLFVA